MRVKENVTCGWLFSLISVTGEGGFHPVARLAKT